MPLTAKGQEILASLEKQYGPKKAEQVLYAGKNKGTFSGIDSAVRAIADSVATLSNRMDACFHDGVPIPPPKDPKEREAWERKVAERKATGQGKYVGDAAAHDDAEKESPAYNREAAEQAIKSSERRGGKVSGKERQAIHSLLKGWRGDDASKEKLSAILDSIDSLCARMDACFAPHVIPQK